MPPRSVIDAALAAWKRLEDGDLFLTIGFELAFGLRTGEIQQLK